MEAKYKEETTLKWILLDYIKMQLKATWILNLLK